jgi:hypothetical protein
MTLGKLLFCAAMSGAFTCAACTSPGGNVTVLRSADTLVVAGTTYSWAPLTTQELLNRDPRVDNNATRRRIRAAIDASLSAKGYRQVSDPSAAALLVSYRIGPQSGTGSRAGNRRGADATLRIDLKDRPSGLLAWRATTQKRVDTRNGAQEQLNAMAADMTRSLPAWKW